MQSSIKSTLDSNSIRLFLDEHCQGAPVLLAVSGGLDSMVMWNLVHSSGYPYAVAHINYHLRDEESNADQALVEEIATHLSSTLFVHHDRTLSKACAGIQASAREIRYSFFESLNTKFPFICTAHHADDQVETVLLQLGRGIGPRSLAGISMANESRLRPLLPFSKEDLRSYAHAQHVKFRDDASNASDDYLRNRVRHHLAPLANKLFESFRQNIIHTAEQQQELLSFAAAMSRLQVEKCRSERWHHALVRKRITQLPGYSFFMHELLRGHAFSAEVVNSISTALNDGIEQKRQYLNRPATIRLVLSGKTVQLENTSTLPSFKIMIDSMGNFDSPLGKLEVSKGGTETSFSESEIWVPTLENLSWQSTSAKDSIQISATESKVAKRVLAEAKLPVLQQNRTSTIVQDEAVIWVVGIRKSSTLPNKKAKTAGYRLRFIPSPEGKGCIAF